MWEDLSLKLVFFTVNPGLEMVLGPRDEDVEGSGCCCRLISSEGRSMAIEGIAGVGVA
jgi:hypothetical protein